MNAAVDPAILALGLTGGSAGLGAIYLTERRREARMLDGRVRHDVVFPVGATEAQAAAALSDLAGAGPDNEFVLELRATGEAISHHLHVPAEATAAEHQIAAAIPGTRIEPSGPDEMARTLSTLALRIYVPSSALLRTDNAESAIRGLLRPLALLTPDEEVRLYVALRPADARLPEGEPKTPADRDHHRRLRQRLTEPTFAVGLLAVARTESRPRSRALLDGIAQSLRSRLLEGRRMRFTYDASGRRLGATPRSSRRAATVTGREAVALTTWPLGSEVIPRVSLGALREIPVPDVVAREGVQLLIGRDHTGDRPVCLNPAAQRLHTLIIGPTGSGKSTLIARMVLDSIAAGQAGMVIDPKEGSLVQAIIDRVPDEHRDRIVVLDPAERRAPIGVDLFASGDADLRAEAITATLRAIYAPMGAFGVRSETYIALAIRSLAVLENPSLLLIGRLFTDARLRQLVVSRLDDPVLQMAWAAFSDMTPEAQREIVAAPLNRLMGILQRPTVRNTLAQPRPALNLEELWNRRGFLLVDLAPGATGEGPARLSASILGFLAWSSLEARAVIPEHERIPTNLVLDELQALSELPFSIERLAERSRAFGGQLLLATQAASRLPKPLSDAILGNFATVVSFKANATEARLAREFPGLEPQDLMALPVYGVAGRVATGAGTGTVTLTGRTEPLPRVTGNGSYIRERSAEQYGTPRAELERAIREQLGGDLTGPSDRPAPGRRRRAS
jgi:YD repeat-containing protein